MIVVDASVLIAHFDVHDANHARAETALLETAEYPLAASTLTLAEVLVAPARAGKVDAVRTALRDLEVGEVPILPGSADELAILRAETGLKLPDCCVLLAAQSVHADVVLTFDDRLAKRARELGYRDSPEDPDEDG